MMTMDGKEQQTMGATHSLLYRELLVTQNKFAEQVEWVKHVFSEDRKAVAAALARAEAAEAEAKAAADRIMVLDVAFSNSHKLNEHLGDENRALAARVAELEAQLAAQGWRPVTEKPDKPGWYVVYDSDGHVFYNADIFPYRVARWTGKWDSAFNGLVDYWRPLPPAPAPQEPTP